jgi:hypothetical protein
MIKQMKCLELTCINNVDIDVLKFIKKKRLDHNIHHNY